MKFKIIALFFICTAAVDAIDFSIYADHDDSRLRMDYGDMCLYANIIDQTAAAGLLNQEYEYVLGFLGRGGLAGFVSGDWDRPAMPGIRSACLPGAGSLGEVFRISDAESTAVYPGVELRTRRGLLGYTTEGVYGAANLGRGMFSLYASREAARKSDQWYFDAGAASASEAGGWLFVPSVRWSERWISLQASAFLGEYTMPRYKGGVSLAASIGVGDFVSVGTGLWAVYEYVPDMVKIGVLPDGGASFQLSMGNENQEIRLHTSAVFTDAFLKTDARAEYHSGRVFISAGARSIEVFAVYEGVSGNMPGLYISGGYKGRQNSFMCAVSYKERLGRLRAGVSLGTFSVSLGGEVPFENTRAFSLKDVQISKLSAKWIQEWGFLKVELDSKWRASVLLTLGIVDSELDDSSIIDEYSE